MTVAIVVGDKWRASVRRWGRAGVQVGTRYLHWDDAWREVPTRRPDAAVATRRKYWFLFISASFVRIYWFIL